MYGGLLPGTGGFFINPLRAIYILIALVAFCGRWLARRRARKRSKMHDE